MNRKGETNSTYPDHFPMIVALEMPTEIGKVKNKTRWNLNKPGGWKNYKETSDKFAKEIVMLVNDEKLDKEERQKKLEKVENKIKYIAFGKTKLKASKEKIFDTKNTDNEKDENENDMKLLRKQSERIEKYVKTIREKKLGRCTEVFKMREAICGPKKVGQEATAIKDFKTGDMVVNQEEIKKSSLEYCLDVLTKNELDDDFKDQHKFKEDLLKEMFLKSDKTDDKELKIEDFRRTLDKMKLKNKKGYDFIVKSGDKYKEAIFEVCRKVIEREEIPEKYDETLLIQLYKGKGMFQDLSNSRFIHTKIWCPHLCEVWWLVI